MEHVTPDGLAMVVALWGSSPLHVPDDTIGVTEDARKLLAQDARTPRVRTFIMHGEKENAQVSAHFLEAWVTYENSPEYRELWLTEKGASPLLVHRKEALNGGFTAFAKEHLLWSMDFIKDSEARVYSFGGRDEKGRRVREEMHLPLVFAWNYYAFSPNLTRMWVMWKGKRRLVHRKHSLQPMTNPEGISS